jgi:hypothetical protein
VCLADFAVAVAFHQSAAERSALERAPEWFRVFAVAAEWAARDDSAGERTLHRFAAFAVLAAGSPVAAERGAELRQEDCVLFARLANQRRVLSLTVEDCHARPDFVTNEALRSIAH